MPATLRKKLFPELRKSGGFATTIEGELRCRFEENFETGMKMFIETRKVEISTLLREMSKYFAQFTPGPNNLYRKLALSLSQRSQNLKAHTGYPTVLATLNYDLLLEQAILDAGSGVEYPANTRGTHYLYPPSTLKLRQDIVDNYWAKYNAICPIEYSAFEILKVHGSCNFLPDIPPENFRNVTYENVEVAVEAPAVPVLPGKKILEWLRRSDSSLAPAISMYAEGKQVMFSHNYIQEHQSRFQATVREAEKIFLIGAAIWRPDTHIWEHVASSNAWLGYIGGEPDDFRAWCKETKHSNYDILGTYFEDTLPAIEEEIDNAVH